jgi:hypothetical protein
MYKLIKNPFNGKEDIVNKIDGDFVLTIPFAPDNTDYQEYLKWVAAGNTPTPADK